MNYFFSLLFLTLAIVANAQHKLIKVNQKNNRPEETSIAISPVNPLLVAAASNINNYYFSTNGGKTWKEKTLKSVNGTWGDPMVHFDREGNLYYAHLGKNKEKYFPDWIDRIVVQRININYDSCFADAAVGLNANKIQDKEWLSSDQNGNLFLTWTEFDKYNSRKPGDHSRIRFSRSDDKGLTWTVPLVVSDVEGDCMDGDSTMEGATSCIDNRGNIYVCWSGINKIWLDKSSDGGKTFGKDRIIANQAEGWDIPVKNIFRANGMPFILCDASTTKFRNRIYMNWADTRNGDPDIFIKYSDDGGVTWSKDTRVNDDKIGNGAKQYCNNICIDESTGNLYIVFYDTRNSTTGSFIDVYVACSEDGGVTWKNFRITPRPFAAPGKNAFFGDYIDIDAMNGNVMPIFTVNEKDKYNVYTTHLNLLSAANYHAQVDMQAAILNDTLYLHLIIPKNRDYTLTITTNGITTSYRRQGPDDEPEYALTARGFYEAKIQLKYGLKKKRLKVIHRKS